MAALLRGEGLRWQGGRGELHFEWPQGGRAVTTGGDVAKRAAFRALIGGRVRHFDREGFTAGEVYWLGRSAKRLSRREWRSWQRSAIVLATDPRRSFLPSSRVEVLLREIGSRGEESHRWLEIAGLPRAIRPWPIRWLSTVRRLQLLYALALARQPTLIILDDFAAFIAEEVWRALLRRWMAHTPPNVAVVATLQKTSPPPGVEVISLDF